jgi:hypothetical protein
MMRQYHASVVSVLTIAAAILVGPFAAPLAAQPRLTQEFLSHQRSVVERWLEDSELRGKLEVIRLRTSEHPDPEADQRRGYRLELRFLTDGSVEAAGADFQRFLDAQAKTSGQPFMAMCFYRLVHLLGVGREPVSVHFFVLETEYAMFFETASRQLTIRELSTRGLQKRMALTAPSAAESSRASALPRAGGDIRALIRGFLENHFRRPTSGQRQPLPALDWEAFDPDHLELSVSGLRGHVVSSHTYWEKLKISLDIRAEATEWKLVWYIDGLLASGMGSNQPADDSYYLMEKDFRAPFEAYANRLVSGLQVAVNSGR